jgi:hypothetical protein
MKRSLTLVICWVAGVLLLGQFRQWDVDERHLFLYCALCVGFDGATLIGLSQKALSSGSVSNERNRDIRFLFLALGGRILPWGALAYLFSHYYPPRYAEQYILGILTLPFMVIFPKKTK